MDLRILLLLLITGLASLFCGAACARIFAANGVWEWDSDGDAPQPESYDSSPGPEKMSIDIVQVEEEEEEATKERVGSEVDEETIRKAEKMADEDLLNGLNRILRNNETLKDLLQAENVYRIS